jgi:hypothetical protein
MFNPNSSDSAVYPMLLRQIKSLNSPHVKYRGEKKEQVSVLNLMNYYKLCNWHIVHAEYNT